ncbi:hypothetical protein QUG67_22930, partial [Enterobacter hormaechei]|uniref:hypothetical protein n=1 Tax=Enterobacter hormaechei TaxID=158836 RepID=UPI0025A27FF4
AQWMPQWLALYPVVALPVAFCLTAGIGMVLERTVIRHLYGRPHVETQTRFVQNEPGEEQHQQYKAEHHNTVPGQRQVGENLH